ncbi:MAG: alpha-L-rhamnosidase [Opitutales bacterium]|nr:alpha-L-rhamnosidase [Opitutales bacterium]
MKSTKAIIFCAAALSACALSAKNRDGDATWSNVPAPLKSAYWVWPGTAKNDSMLNELFNSYAKMRQSFDLAEAPKSAPLYISADQSYRLYVNGTFVTSGPARGFQNSQPFDEIDIAKYLKAGKNTIAIRAHNPGRSTFSYLTQGVGGVIFALDLGGGKTVLSSSATRAARQYGCDRDTAQLSVQMCNQEHIDLRVENPDWINPGFDESEWGKRKRNKLAVFNAMPFYAFESRMIPQPENKIILPKASVSSGGGKALFEGERIVNLMDIFKGEKVSEIAGNAGASCAVLEAAPAPKGTFRNFLIDFGKVVAGFPILKIENAKGGEIVDILLTEAHENGTGETGVFSNPAPAHRLVCRAGSQTHQFYHLAGFRYMTIRVRNNPNSALKISPSLMWSAYPLADKGKFETSNKLANDIWQACKQTQKICSHDAYIDTPYREQAQWWGDARVQAWNTFFISGDARLLRRGIRSISMQKTPNGLTYGHAPTMAHTCILPDFSLVWILSIWDHYWQTGDIEAYLNHRDTVESILSYFDANTDPRTGLVKADPRYWLFLDWTNIQKNGQPALLNLWLLEALEKMKKLCADNGLERDAENYRARAEKVREAIEKNLLLPGGLISDGILPDGKQNPNASPHAQVLGKMTNIKGLDFEKAKREKIMPILAGETKMYAQPSSYWVVYLLRLMCDEGCNGEVYRYILREWKPFAEYGTTSETFPYNRLYGTRSHAWSAHPAFILPQILGGVKQTAEGWSKVSISPNFFEDSAQIVYPTPKGDIKVSWRKKPDGAFEKKISVPKGIEVEK